MNIENDIKLDANTCNEFEESYISLRKKEGRLFSDEEVAQLPCVTTSHPLKKEWNIRKASCLQLLKYLSQKQKVLSILEVGCGNGWLSNRLSMVKDSMVVGLDVNEVELNQAERAFGNQHNVNFFCGDLRSGILGSKTFDVIVFAASIQYFPSLHEIIEAALSQLNKEGEIHFLDSHFYSSANEAEQARQRSNNYFSSLGYGKMIAFYFHHCLSDLAGYNYTILHNPNTFFHKLFNKANPFHWICIKH